VAEVNADVQILVVEDDPAVAASLVEGIGQEGYQVHLEATAAGAQTYARTHRPHLAVLDIRLPDGSGFDVCRELRLAGLRWPILMLTVQGDEVDKVLGLEVGADDYLTKPYRLRELLARIRALLRRAYGEFSSIDADVLYAGDLVVDRTSAQVTRAGRPINLTPTEFRLLAFLAQHPGQVFSRDQLLENVWGYTADSFDEKTVTVHVRRLRAKIEPDPGEPTIVLTVPGLGYRLAV
jgi:DNA-binding response OmpR family regulator